MHIATKTSVLLISAIGLAGCDEASEPFAFDTTYTNFADISNAFSADVDLNVDEDGDLQNLADRSETATLEAESGSAIYNGAIVAQQESSGPVMIGQLQLEVDFDTTGIDGRAGNFIKSNDEVVDGTLFGTGNFNPDFSADANGHHFNMDLEGVLVDDGTGYNTTITLGGNFLDTNGDADDIAGDADIIMDGGPVFDDGAFSVSR
ncbi:hypothetical protein QTO30_05390 [Yoonia sp. GPGPB17]|uniref:hypothetical protein n=1 Tax=Yoonia sp. GPGPB17 TaxID=3026147 RepID=UPI0030BD0A49